jgi:hypothetical protein
LQPWFPSSLRSAFWPFGGEFKGRILAHGLCIPNVFDRARGYTFRIEFRYRALRWLSDRCFGENRCESSLQAFAASLLPRNFPEAPLAQPQDACS